MYARSTTVQGNAEFIDRATVYLRDKVMPAVQGLTGFVGLSVLHDRDSGRCVATTAWATEEAMHDSESPLHALRQRYAEILGGRPEVQEWEIAVLHRLRATPDRAACRVIWSRSDPAMDQEQAMDAVRTGLIPQLDRVPGFCSMSMLVDRETGRAVTATVYETREALARATERVMQLRDEARHRTGAEITEVAQFEVGLAHLRVPETV
jgi:heme-degrading monooxygenase HmoA